MTAPIDITGSAERFRANLLQAIGQAADDYARANKAYMLNPSRETLDLSAACQNRLLAIARALHPASGTVEEGSARVGEVAGGEVSSPGEWYVGLTGDTSPVHRYCVMRKLPDGAVEVLQYVSTCASALKIARQANAGLAGPICDAWGLSLNDAVHRGCGAPYEDVQADAPATASKTATDGTLRASRPQEAAHDGGTTSAPDGKPMLTPVVGRIQDRSAAGAGERAPDKGHDDHDGGPSAERDKTGETGTSPTQLPADELTAHANGWRARALSAEKSLQNALSDAATYLGSIGQVCQARGERDSLRAEVARLEAALEASEEEYRVFQNNSRAEHQRLQDERDAAAARERAEIADAMRFQRANHTLKEDLRAGLTLAIILVSERCYAKPEPPAPPPAPVPQAAVPRGHCGDVRDGHTCRLPVGHDGWHQEHASNPCWSPIPERHLSHSSRQPSSGTAAPSSDTGPKSEGQGTTVGGLAPSPVEDKREPQGAMSGSGDSRRDGAFIVRLTCCDQDNGRYGPVATWKEADDFCESYIAHADGHKRTAIIEAVPTSGPSPARPSPVDERVRAARAPLPPEILVGALHDRVHTETGKLLASMPLAKPPADARQLAPVPSTFRVVRLDDGRVQLAPVGDNCSPPIHLRDADALQLARDILAALPTDPHETRLTARECRETPLAFARFLIALAEQAAR